MLYPAILNAMLGWPSSVFPSLPGYPKTLSSLEDALGVLCANQGPAAWSGSALLLVSGASLDVAGAASELGLASELDESVPGTIFVRLPTAKTGLLNPASRAATAMLLISLMAFLRCSPACQFGRTRLDRPARDTLRAAAGGHLVVTALNTATVPPISAFTAP